jgi:putative transposase
MPYNEEFNQEYSKRLLRGAQIIEKGIEPKQLTHNSFEIPSQSKYLNYIVTCYANSWRCTCPDYQYRHVTCKHIHAVTLWQKLSRKLEEDHKGKSVFAPSKAIGISCKFCSSSDIIKYGKKNGRQNFMCKSCARKFVLNQGFEGMCYDPRIVATTLDLYFKGVSLRKISDHLKQFYGLKIDHSTIHRWISKYTDIIEAYVASLEPDLGNVWHTDEMKVKIGGEWRWLWNVMDERTRFQLVSVITKTREIQDAKKAFRKSKEAGGKKPMLMVTDGLASYKKAFNSEFYDHHQSCKHVADVGLQESLNNDLERMHGSIREREKVMRGIKVDDTPIIPMNQIYYNFVRPHMGLKGRTPAEAAGVGVSGENKWEGLLKRSITTQ